MGKSQLWVATMGNLGFNVLICKWRGTWEGGGGEEDLLRIHVWKVKCLVTIKCSIHGPCHDYYYWELSLLFSLCIRLPDKSFLSLSFPVRLFSVASQLESGHGSCGPPHLSCPSLHRYHAPLSADLALLMAPNGIPPPPPPRAPTSVHISCDICHILPAMVVSEHLS